MAAQPRSYTLLTKHSPIPLYYQLAERLKEQIHSGEFAPGARLPSERELSEQVGVSRMTARQAIAYLARQGIIDVRSGVGAFVAQPKLAYDALHLLGFSEAMSLAGSNVTSDVIEQNIVNASPHVARHLDLGSDSQVIKIVRLRRVNGEPVLLETIYIPAALCPGLHERDLSTTSLYALMEQEYGLRLRHSQQSIEATLANQYEQELFHLAKPMAMILLEGTTLDDQDRKVEYFRAIYRGDRCSFLLESYRHASANSEGSGARVSMVVA